MRRRYAASYVEAWRRFGRMTRGSIEESDGVTRIATGLPQAHFNQMFVTEPPRDPEGVIGAGRSFFARQGVPWSLIILDDGRGEAAPLEQAAEAAGLELSAINPGLGLAPLPTEERAPVEGLSVRVVDTPEDLAVYAKVLTEGFESAPDELLPFNRPESLRELDMTRYLGRVDGEPVATGLRITANRVAVIFNVVTRSPWRRRGMGEAITMRAARDGLAEGCVASFLQSSVMGFSMYLRAGFQRVTNFQFWIMKSA
jgi:hypothetical protein